MHNIIYDIISTFTASVIFSLCFLILYAIEKRGYLLYWALSWLFFSAVHMMQIFKIELSNNFMLNLAALSFVLLNSVFFLLGVLRFLHNKKYRKVFPLMMSGWLVFAMLYFLDFHRVLLFYAVYMAAAAVFIYCGVMLYKNSPNKGYGGRIAGVTLVLWGLHKADYPFMNSSAWFLPLGYQLVIVFTLLTALGIVLMHFEKIKLDMGEREDLFRDVAEAAKDIVFIVEHTPAMELKYVSAAVTRITGYSRAEIFSSADLRNTIIMDYLMRTIGIANIPAQQNQMANIQEIITKSGKKIMLAYSHTHYYGIDGSLEKTIGFAKDVTGDVLAFDTIVDRQDWYEALFHKSYNMQLLINGETGHIVDANKHVLRFYGYDIDEIRHMDFSELFTSAQESSRFWENSYKVMEPEGYQHRNSAGDVLNVVVYSSPVEFDNIKYLYVNITDITDEMRFRKELRNIKTLHSAILESLNEGVIGIDEKGDIFFLNAYVSNLLGYLEHELIGKNPHEFIHHDSPEGHIGRDNCPIIGFLNNEDYEKTYRDFMMSRDGEVIPVEITLRRLRYYDEKQRSIIVFRDISADIEHEQSMMNQITENRILLQEVHHRVKNNLQIVCSLLSIQMDSTVDKTSAKSLNDSIARIKSMSLIHELLYQTKGLNALSLKTYLERLVFDLHSIMASDEGIQLLTDIEDINISLDRAVPFGLIITELLTNAIKHAFREHTGDKTVEVGFKTAEDGSILWVKDNGVGISPDKGADSKTMGLTVVNSLARQLKGTISYVNDSGLRVQIKIADNNGAAQK